MGENRNEASGEHFLGPAEGADRLDLLYSTYAEAVRRHLAGFGVHPVDIEDLSQEVFLVVTDKRAGLSEIERMDLWLREISRKVAAGYRRRGFRLREVSVAGEHQASDDSAPLQSALLESQEDAARLYQAVDALDDEAKDLIAMHELGGLPLVDVATLIDCDRKTVRKRLDEANRRLTRLFREHAPKHKAFAAGPLHGYLPVAARTEHAEARALLPMGATRDITIGLIGLVVVAVWSGPPTLEALELLDEQMDEAVKLCGRGLVYLAVVEGTTGTPSLPARKKISSMLRRHSQTFGVYPHVLLGGFSWIARPIMAGLSFLSGIPLPMPFFGNVERAAAWLCHGYLRESRVVAADIVQAARQLRESARLPGSAYLPAGAAGADAGSL